MKGWALDLGTTNSRIARWDDAAGQHVRFVDEPVAAALGYGLSLTHERVVHDLLARKELMREEPVVRCASSRRRAWAS